MADERKIKFGSDNAYNYDYSISSLDNWRKMKAHYLETEGRDIGDFPVLTEEEDKELEKNLAFIK